MTFIFWFKTDNHDTIKVDIYLDVKLIRKKVVLTNNRRNLYYARRSQEKLHMGP